MLDYLSKCGLKRVAEVLNICFKFFWSGLPFVLGVC